MYVDIHDPFSALDPSAILVRNVEDALILSQILVY